MFFFLILILSLINIYYFVLIFFSILGNIQYLLFVVVLVIDDSECVSVCECVFVIVIFKSLMNTENAFQFGKNFNLAQVNHQ